MKVLKEHEGSEVLYRNGLRLRKLIKKIELTHDREHSELHPLTFLLFLLRADERWRALF